MFRSQHIEIWEYPWELTFFSRNFKSLKFLIKEIKRILNVHQNVHHSLLSVNFRMLIKITQL